MNEITYDGVIDEAASQPARVNVLGVGVTAIDMDAALAQSDALIQASACGYVCVDKVS